MRWQKERDCGFLFNSENNISILAEHFQRRHLPLEKLQPPTAGMVHLWYLDLQMLGSPLLSSAGAGPVRLSPRALRSTRRFYLRLLLGAYLGLPGKDVQISKIAKGKPVLDQKVHGVALDFSTAGSAQSCLIGVTSDGPVGVDLEISGRKTLQPRSLVRRYFSAAEQTAFDAMHDDEIDRSFLHVWALKEAIVKARGHGIANQLSRFSVSTAPDADPRLESMEDDDAACWRLAKIQPAKGFHAAVALRQPEITLKGFSLNPPTGPR